MMTKKNFFEQIVSLSLSDEMTEFAKHQLELLDRPRSTAPTAKQKENEIIKAAFVEMLKNAEAPMTIEEIRTNTDGLSSQRVSALLSQLVKAEQIVRIEGKGKAKVTFTMPSAE